MNQNVMALLLLLGIILEYEQSGMMKSKSIDLLDLKPRYVYLKFFSRVPVFLPP
jgi:hypothetical protein